jgi:hypothetical protein
MIAEEHENKKLVKESENYETAERSTPKEMDFDSIQCFFFLSMKFRQQSSKQKQVSI